MSLVASSVAVWEAWSGPWNQTRAATRIQPATETTAQTVVSMDGTRGRRAGLSVCFFVCMPIRRLREPRSPGTGGFGPWGETAPGTFGSRRRRGGQAQKYGEAYARQHDDAEPCKQDEQAPVRQTVYDSSRVEDAQHRRHGQFPAGKRGPHDAAVVVVGTLGVLGAALVTARANPCPSPVPPRPYGPGPAPGPDARQNRNFPRPGESPPAVLYPRDLPGPYPAVSGRIPASGTNKITIADCGRGTAVTKLSFSRDDRHTPVDDMPRREGVRHGPWGWSGPYGGLAPPRRRVTLEGLVHGHRIR